MGGKTKLLRIKHLKHSQGHVHIHDCGLHVALRIFMSESLSASGGASALRHSTFGGHLKRILVSGSGAYGPDKHG